jgi:CHAD domain-containing protein
MNPQHDGLPDRATLLLKERVRTLFRHLPKALAGEEEPIHQMRVAARRLRVALPLLARKPRGRRVRSTLSILRAITRAGGGSRDLDVGLGLFEERLGGLEAIGPELTTLRRRLRAARTRSRTRMANDLLDIPISRLRRLLAGILHRRGEDVFTVMSRLRDASESGGTRLVQAVDDLADRFELNELHNLRIATRRLRYTAEVLDAIKGQAMGAPPLFKQVQERLGRIHDAHVLGLWLAQRAAGAEKQGQVELAAEARRQEEWFMELSRNEHLAFLADQPRALLGRALEAMGPGRTAA